VIGAGRTLRGDAVAIGAAGLVGLTAAAGHGLAGSADAALARGAIEVVLTLAGLAVAARDASGQAEEGQDSELGQAHTASL
jgi:hypothetical protein